MKKFILALLLGSTLSSAFAADETVNISEPVRQEQIEKEEAKASDHAAYLKLVRATIDLMGPQEANASEAMTASAQ